MDGLSIASSHSGNTMQLPQNEENAVLPTSEVEENETSSLFTPSAIEAQQTRVRQFALHSRAESFIRMYWKLMGVAFIFYFLSYIASLIISPPDDPNRDPSDPAPPSKVEKYMLLIGIWFNLAAIVATYYAHSARDGADPRESQPLLPR
jgi:hypothetical protein